MSGYGIRTLTAESRIKSRWYPKGSMEIRHPEGLGVAYVSLFDTPQSNNCTRVVSFKGTAQKSEQRLFRKNEEAERYVAELFESWSSRKQRVAQWRAEQNKPCTLSVGDIITNSWGYDQTNVDAYQIVRKSEHFVWLRPIACEHIAGEGCSPMAGYVKPIPGAFCEGSEETQHKASGENVCFRHGSGSKWDGQSKLYESWYA